MGEIHLVGFIKVEGGVTDRFVDEVDKEDDDEDDEGDEGGNEEDDEDDEEIDKGTSINSSLFSFVFLSRFVEGNKIV